MCVCVCVCVWWCGGVVMWGVGITYSFPKCQKKKVLQLPPRVWSRVSEAKGLEMRGWISDKD